MVMRRRRTRFIRAFLLGVVALALLFAWDDSRQPVAGTNWALLAARRVIGTPHSVRLIADAPTLAAAWDDFRMAGDPASFDLSRSLVLWVATASPQGCPARLDGVTIDRATRTVTARFSRGFTFACDTRQVTDSFLVTVDRSSLPSAPFTVALDDPDATVRATDVVVDR